VSRLVAEHAVPARGQRATSDFPPLLIVDESRRCVEVNEAACELLGTRRRSVLGRRLDELFAGDMQTRLEYVWRAFRKGGGHAGPFGVASASANADAVHINVAADVLPGRHIVLLSPAGEGASGLDDAREAPDHDEDEHRQSWRRPSARELQILGLLATGATDIQIAGDLGLSPATVQTHVRNAKAKLGARTRAQAVALALERRMISLG
jgi:DNA-binding CsgD family transcriptional regulator